MEIQRPGAVVIAVAAFILSSLPGRAQNITVFTGDEVISLATPPSVATAPSSSSPLDAAAADQSIPILQLGQTVQSRVAQVREVLPAYLLSMRMGPKTISLLRWLGTTLPNNALKFALLLRKHRSSAFIQCDIHSCVLGISLTGNQPHSIYCIW